MDQKVKVLEAVFMVVVDRVVSPEISAGKFPEIYSNLSGNFYSRKISGNFH